MSSNLCWEPVYRAQKVLPYALKLAMQKRFGGTVRDRNLDGADVPYLEGLRDAGIAGADDLIAAIEKFGTINVTELF
jgi:hypothetical protein